jgi:hypothetical protein
VFVKLLVSGTIQNFEIRQRILYTFLIACFEKAATTDELICAKLFCCLKVYTKLNKPHNLIEFTKIALKLINRSISKKSADLNVKKLASFVYFLTARHLKVLLQALNVIVDIITSKKEDFIFVQAWLDVLLEFNVHLSADMHFDLDIQESIKHVHQKLIKIIVTLILD